MTSLTDRDIERIAHGVMERTLPKAAWTHEAHFATAIFMLSRHGDDAFAMMPELIRAYNEASGTPNTDMGGYHETITQASLLAARAVLRGMEGAALSAVLGELMRREFGRSGWLMAYWRKETLFSVTARRTWVEPDVQAMPFA